MRFRLLQEAALGGASLVVLPEIWNSAYETPAFPRNAEDVDGGKSRSASFLADLAKKHRITLSDPSYITRYRISPTYPRAEPNNSNLAGASFL